MKLYMIEYTWDDMPHGDIFPLPEPTNEAAIEYLHKNVSMDFDDEDDTKSLFEIDSLSEVTDMIDSQGNGGIEAYTLFGIAIRRLAEAEGVSEAGLRHTLNDTLAEAVSDLKTAAQS